MSRKINEINITKKQNKKQPLVLFVAEENAHKGYK